MTSSNYNEPTVGAWTKDRRANLTRAVAYIALGISVFYLGFDYLSGAYAYLPFYGILVFGAVSSLVLLRFKHRTLAKISLLIFALILLTIFSSWETSETGVFMYYLVAALGAVTLFGPEEKWHAFGIGALTVFLFYVAYQTNWLGYEKLVLSEDYIKKSLLINYIICLFASMTMVYYILTIGQRYEREVVEKEKDLFSITDQLEKSKQKFELAIKGSSAGIWDWDLVHKSLYISPQIMKMLGYGDREKGDISSDDFINHIHPDDYELMMDKIIRHFKNKENFKAESRLIKRNGDFLWVLNTGQAVWDDNDMALRMVGSIVDISERKKAEEELHSKNEMLKKANEELDSFVYSTSHDLRAPLSSVLGLVNLAQTSEDSEEIEKCLDLMKERVDTLNAFISEITNYSRNTRLEVAQNNIKLSGVLQDICDNLEFFERSKEIALEKKFDPDFSFISDKSRLKIILNNLIANAIKYHDLDKKNPFIFINASKTANYIKITIEDNGRGIEPQYQENVFNMFYRASSESEGSGLGLYIAKEMVEKLGGEIALESTFGKGSKFMISLPVI